MKEAKKFDACTVICISNRHTPIYTRCYYALSASFKVLIQ